MSGQAIVLLQGSIDGLDYCLSTGMKISSSSFR